MKYSALFLSLFLLASCALSSPIAETPAITADKPAIPQTARALRQGMIGNWVGEAPLKEGGVRKWLVQRKADGTYLVTFLMKPTGKPEQRHQEVGFWGVSGPVYFSIMKGWVTENGVTPSDPTDPYFYDAYKILTLDSEQFNYESFSTGNVFSIKKVSDSFTEKDL